MKNISLGCVVRRLEKARAAHSLLFADAFSSLPLHLNCCYFNFPLQIHHSFSFSKTHFLNFSLEGTCPWVSPDLGRGHVLSC